MFLSSERCVLLGRGVCAGPVIQTSLTEYVRVCVFVCLCVCVCVCVAECDQVQ